MYGKQPQNNTPRLNINLKQNNFRSPNVKFPWSVDDLPTAEPVFSPPILITTGMAEAINKMKQSNAPDPTGIMAAIFKALVEVSCPLLCNLAKARTCT